MRAQTTSRLLSLMLGGILLIGLHSAQADATLQTSSPASVAPAAIRAPGNWQTECVDCPTYLNFMAYDYWSTRSLRVDKANHPHVVYTGEEGLLYARHDGMQWHRQVVLSARIGGVTLALDDSDRPYIAYVTGGNLELVWNDGSGWLTRTVDSGVSLVPALAIDAAGHPHVAYMANYQVRYARWTGSSWDIQILEDRGMVPYGGGSVSLVLDASHRPHISYNSVETVYKAGDYYTLMYAYWSGSAWQTRMVEYEGANPVPYHRPYHSALALDRSGQPHIVYGQTSPLKYARWTGAEWQVRIVEWAGQGNGCGLELDASDAPHVVYSTVHGATGSSTRYAYWTGGQWAIHPIADWTQKAAFDLDSHGRPHIAHVSSISGSMDYARYDGRNWHSQTIDVSRVVELSYLDDPLALDSMGRGHISYTSVDTTAGRVLKYARYDGSRWQTETVPLGSSNRVRRLNSALALDKTGRPHIAYAAYVTEYDLFYAWKDGQTWHTEDVGSVVYPDKCLLTLDGNDQPHIACGGYDAVRYARRDGTGWHMELVESYYPMGFASIVVDGQDHPHIVYGTSNTSRGLRHAWHDGAAWHIETIAQDSQVHYVSAVLDSQGRLQVGYEGATTGLGYALYDGTAWHTETVTATSTSHLSLAVDGQDRPHIVYNHHQYAWFDGSAWQFEAAGDPAGEYPALAVDTRGQPHISYYDPIGRDLKYARLVLPSPSLDKQANPMDDVLNCDIVTYTLVISAPGMGIQLWDPLPPDVHYITDSLTNTIAPRAVYSSTARAVMWQGAIPTDTVQTIRFQLTSNITGTMVLSPSLPVVNTAWITDTYSGLGLSDTVIVNGWRVYLIMMMKKESP